MYVYQDPFKGKTFSIQKEHHVICFGSPGYIKEWRTVGSYDNLEEAEKELARLEKFDPKAVYKIEDSRRNMAWMILK